MAEKYATGGTFGTLLKDPRFWAAAPVAASAVAYGGGTALKKVMEAKAKATGYKRMLEMHPDLQTRDPVLVQRIYSSLHHVNPMMATDPMVAGAWVDTIVESGGLDARGSSRALLEGVKELAGIRSNMARAKKEEGGGFAGAASGFASKNVETLGKIVNYDPRHRAVEESELQGKYENALKRNAKP